MPAGNMAHGHRPEPPSASTRVRRLSPGQTTGLAAGAGASAVLELQRRAGNRAVTRMLDEQPVQRATPKKKPTPSAIRKQRHKAAIKAFKAGNVLHPASIVQAGQWTKDVRLRGARSFKKKPNEQVLRHLSIQYFWYLKKVVDTKSKEQEFQAAYLNGRIVIASNNDSSTSSLYTTLTRKLKEFEAQKESPDAKYPLREMLASSHNPGDKRAAGTASKFGSLFEAGDTAADDQADADRMVEDSPAGGAMAGDAMDVDSVPDAAPAPREPRRAREGAEELIARLVARKDLSPFVQADMSGVKDLLSSATGEEKIILLTGVGEYHAEQKLVLALKAAGWSSGAVHIYGKKRPCTACYATLKYARDKCGMTGLSFSQRPGGYWNTAIPGLVRLAEECGHSQEDVDAWIKELMASSFTTHKSLKLGKKTKRAELTSRPARGSSGKDTDAGYGSASDSEPD